MGVITSVSIIFVPILIILGVNGQFVNYDPLVACDEDYNPKYCGLPNVELSKMLTVEDFDRCAPAVMSRFARNFYWGRAGRGLTYQWNLDAFKRIEIIPKMLRDVSKGSLHTTVLGQSIDLPIGYAPTDIQSSANPIGDIGTARVAARAGDVMILSSSSTFSPEMVAREARAASNGRDPVLWMNTYYWKNRRELMSLVRRVEKAGYSALVLTVDLPFAAITNCDSRNELVSMKLKFPSVFNETVSLNKLDASITYKDLTWLKRRTKLPIVVKGILTGEDALKAIKAGASAIYVSNHGGRQLDGAPAAITALVDVVRAVRGSGSNVEIYMDGGVRNGYDVYKAIARGARMVFIGRPIGWGLAIGGEDGVEKVLSILKTEFNETMLLAGATTPKDIRSSSVTY